MTFELGSSSLDVGSDTIPKELAKRGLNKTINRGSASFTVHRTLKLSASNARFSIQSQLWVECPSMDMPPSPLAVVHGGAAIPMNTDNGYSKSLL